MLVGRRSPFLFEMVSFQVTFVHFQGGKYPRAKQKTTKRSPSFHTAAQNSVVKQKTSCARKNTLTYQILDVPKKDLNDLLSLVFSILKFFGLSLDVVERHHNQK